MVLLKLFFKKVLNSQYFSKSSKNVVNLTRRIPRKTEIPLIFSTERSTSEAITIIRSKMFQPLWKYSLDNASNLSAASAVKNVVKTLLPEKKAKWDQKCVSEQGHFCHDFIGQKLTQLTNFQNVLKLSTHSMMFNG